MSQKLLIAVDDSQNAQRAVEFVARSFAPDNTITLFNVILDTVALCQMDSPELTPLFRSRQTSFCALEDKKRELVTVALDKDRQILLDAGFDEKKIIVKIESQYYGVAQAILKEAEDGYDLIVIGRRGLSGFKEFFLGSVSHKVFSSAKDISVLIVN